MQEAVFIARPAYQEILLRELASVERIEENLLFAAVDPANICFAEDIWLEPEIVTIDSITHASQILRQSTRYWYAYPLRCIRRAKLIEEKCQNPFARAIPFDPGHVYPDVGGFCLLDQHTMLYSPKRWRKIPFGVAQFQEDKTHPPNRAYLKLWEALMLLGAAPQPGEVALDLGASPGGWSYVLAALGARVIAVDKAPLTPALMQHPNIDYRAQSAFALDPADFPAIDWLCADIACYPERLYALIQRWHASQKVKNFICTIKLQGDVDLSMIKLFQAIPGAYVTHLHYNKHEVTFFCSHLHS